MEFRPQRKKTRGILPEAQARLLTWSNPEEPVLESLRELSKKMEVFGPIRTSGSRIRIPERHAEFVRAVKGFGIQVVLMCSNCKQEFRVEDPRKGYRVSSTAAEFVCSDACRMALGRRRERERERNVKDEPASQTEERLRGEAKRSLESKHLFEALVSGALKKKDPIEYNGFLREIGGDEVKGLKILNHWYREVQGSCTASVFETLKPEHQRLFFRGRARHSKSFY